MFDRVVICGVPKSGTKLLNHMMHTALPDWDYTPEERNFFKNTSKYRIITKKPLDLFRFKRIARRFDTVPIITCRDPYMVLTSKHRTPDYWVSAEKIGKGQPPPLTWYEHILYWREHGAFIVYYEELVRDPDAVQARLTELYLGTQFKRRFSEFVNVPMPAGYEGLNVVRPLQARKLTDEDMEYLKKQLRACPELMEIRKALGYNEDSDLP